MQMDNIQRMHDMPFQSEGMDIVIVSVNRPDLEQFWKDRFVITQKHLFKPGARLFVILEDWVGGAGNGLGTLYAIQKACQQDKDLLHRLQEGASMAVYHTAGQGQRAAPLSLSENFNKSAIKLPGYIGSPEEGHLITILEAVIKQTSIYAPSRKGRISVFWGDQLFIPSNILSQPAKCHVDILTRFENIPDEKNWQEKGLEQYGICLRDQENNALQMDKIDFATFQDYLKRHSSRFTAGIGASLGCFSLSAAITKALLDEFSPELNAKKDKLDSDPHFWMATTLDEETYLKMMKAKKTSLEIAKKHYLRMQLFLKNLQASSPHIPFFKTIDIGSESYWWDYGTLSSYYSNNMKLLKTGHEADTMRAFFKINKNSSDSVCINTQIGSGTIQNSLLLGVKAEKIDVKDCLILNVSLTELKSTHSLLYNVHSDVPLTLPESSVRADIQSLPFYTNLNNDGKADWNISLPHNPCSYAEIVSQNTR